MLAGFRFDETNMENFFDLKHNLDNALGKISIIDGVFLHKSTVNLPGFKQRFEQLASPTIHIKAEMKRMIDERQLASRNFVTDGQTQNRRLLTAATPSLTMSPTITLTPI
ncbi:hypothetical protein L596_029333 [Steinernema carpocapsae]|uniref:Uncharacterized protein n=1 Tax=Steinernema carpocapsae TaxID=34508 RepID=A0A4U5LUB9_STECR|nr:hypothetical protein L596_029333 [Steinernema carpocapsae]